MVQTDKVTETVGSLRAELGESPIWDHANQKLVWLDILGRSLHVTDPQSGDSVVAPLATRINSIARTTSGKWVAAGGQGFYDLELDGTLTEFQRLAPDSPGILNDAKCDAAGRLWIGTAMLDGTSRGHLYRLQGDAAPEAVVPGMAMSNGIGWSPDDETIYFADSGAHTLYAADFDTRSGGIDRPRAFYVSDKSCVPDGLALDQAGNIWLAVWGSGALLCLSPDGAVLRRLELPTPRVSSCAFGGHNNRTLFITTACEGASENERAQDEFMGALFKIELDVPGLPVHLFVRKA